MSEWISCSERIPPRWKTVVIKNKLYGMQTVYRHLIFNVWVNPGTKAKFRIWSNDLWKEIE